MLKLESNKIYFDNDDAFYEFCVIPNIVLKTSDIGTMYSDFDFSPQYLDAINQGKIFIIKDENSNIYKHGAVSYKTITKPVSNLGYYYEKPNKRRCPLCQR